MADDYRAEKVLWKPGVTEFPTGFPSSRRHANQAYRAATPPTDPLTEHDAASILGFEVGTLPADVLKIVLQLLAEVGRWKADADAAQHLRHHLEDLADSFPGLPCLNAHAFMRELEEFAQSGTEIGAHLGMVLLIHVAGLDQAVANHGLAAGDFLSRQLFDAITAQTPQGDPIACLGYGAFAIAVPGIDQTAAVRRLEDLVRGLSTQVIEWQGQPIRLSVTSATAPIFQGQAAVEIMHAADERRRAESPSKPQSPSKIDIL